ncbi:HRDC domain, partial [Trinorchestia longiramus]
DVGEYSALGSVVMVLRGSTNQKVKPHWRKFPVFGKGKQKNESYWKALGKQLVLGGYVEERLVTPGGFRGRGGFGVRAFSYSALALTNKGRHTLSQKDCAEVRLAPSTEMREELRYIIKRTVPNHATSRSDQDCIGVVTTNNGSGSLTELYSSNKTQTLHRAQQHTTAPSQPSRPPVEDHLVQKLKSSLYLSLLAVRNKLGDESGYMPYMVANNKTLLEMASSTPTSTHQLLKVEGMTAAKVKKFGTAFVEHIRRFCRDNALPCAALEDEDLDLSKKTKLTLESQTETDQGSEAPGPANNGWLKRSKKKVSPTEPSSTELANNSLVDFNQTPWLGDSDTPTFSSVVPRATTSGDVNGNCCNESSDATTTSYSEQLDQFYDDDINEDALEDWFKIQEERASRDNLSCADGSFLATSQASQGNNNEKSDSTSAFSKSISCSENTPCRQTTLESSSVIGACSTTILRSYSEGRPIASELTLNEASIIQSSSQAAPTVSLTCGMHDALQPASKRVPPSFTNEEQLGKVPLSARSFANSQPVKRKMGVCFDSDSDNDDDDEEKCQVNSAAPVDSEEKYQRILANNRRQIGQRNLDLKKMKSKMKKSSLFR